MPTGIYKHRPHRQETKEKIRKKLKGNKNPLGKHWKIKDTSKMRERQKRLWKDDNYKKMMSEKLKGKKRSLLARIKQGLSIREERHHNWKGNEVGYRALHHWVHRYLGRPKKCEFCGKEKTYPKSIHWANKDHQYRRNLTDWIRLCASCHKQYDLSIFR